MTPLASPVAAKINAAAAAPESAVAAAGASAAAGTEAAVAAAAETSQVYSGMSGGTTEIPLLRWRIVLPN